MELIIRKDNLNKAYLQVKRNKGAGGIDGMQAIMKDADPDSKAKAIVFSLPVSDTAGLRLLEDED